MGQNRDDRTPPQTRVKGVDRHNKKERTMDVIKGYVEVNDDVENETMKYLEKYGPKDKRTIISESESVDSCSCSKDAHLPKVRLALPEM